FSGIDLSPSYFMFFFFPATPPTEFYTLSLHDALPICHLGRARSGSRRRVGLCDAAARHRAGCGGHRPAGGVVRRDRPVRGAVARDRKSTRLNSSHLVISYAVFCLKKKKKIHTKISLHYCIQNTPISQIIALLTDNTQYIV